MSPPSAGTPQGQARLCPGPRLAPEEWHGQGELGGWISGGLHPQGGAVCPFTSPCGCRPATRSACLRGRQPRAAVYGTAASGAVFRAPARTRQRGKARRFGPVVAKVWLPPQEPTSLQSPGLPRLPPRQHHVCPQPAPPAPEGHPQPCRALATHTLCGSPSQPWERTALTAALCPARVRSPPRWSDNLLTKPLPHAGAATVGCPAVERQGEGLTLGPLLFSHCSLPFNQGHQRRLRHPSAHPERPCWVCT